MNTGNRRSFFVIALVAFALFLAVALMQRNPHDWPFGGDASLRAVRNLAGPFGSLVAWACIRSLGTFFAWLVPFFLLVLAGALAVDKTSRLGRGLARACLAILLLNVFFSLLKLTAGSTYLTGWIGKGLAGGLKSIFGQVGGTIVVTACLLIVGLSFIGSLGRTTVARLRGAAFIKKTLRALLLAPIRLLQLAARALRRAPALVGRIAQRHGESAGADSPEIFEGREDRPARHPIDELVQDGSATMEPAVAAAVAEDPPVVKRRVPKARPPIAREGSGSGAGEPREDGKTPIEEASLPPLSLFDGGRENGLAFSQDKLKAWAAVLEEKLAYYKIEGKVTGINHGPLITTFEFAPSPGVKVKDIVSRADDLTLAMKAKSLRLIAPIPGRSVVGIEIPNPEGAFVYLRDILPEIPERLRLSGVMVGIGVDVMGKPFFMNLCNAPHLLVAGTTGSGKSVALHGILASILMQYRPSDVRLLIVDPKMVEMNIYNELPHLLHPVTNDPKETVRMFQYLIEEMERRKELLKESGVKNIESFNSKAAMGGSSDPENAKLPYIILVVDELGDLVLSKGVDMELLLSKLSNMARAVGIHMVVATQRPSVDVIVGKTKANFPTRIAFRVASRVDSRTILDTIGAEKLLGRGDMLYMDAKHTEPIRLHGAFVSEPEVERVISHWKSYRFEPATLELSKAKTSGSWDDMEDDPLYEEAKQVVLHYHQGSTSLLQRRLHIGYARAARLLDMLEQEGIVGPPDGSKPREVLVAGQSSPPYED
jgi:S-DNA-T family DNA segregation ATPase FtsK/SpoIIIE